MKCVLIAAALTALLAAPPLSQVSRAAELKPGLKAEYFDRLFAVSDFPLIAIGEKADVSRVDANIDWNVGNGPLPNTAIVDFGYARWSGVLRVPRDGSYTLWTSSDDGSRVFLNGALVVDNGGVPGEQEKSGTVEIKAGDHPIRVEYFENDSGAVCRLGWQGPGIEKQAVPPEALFHEE